MGTPTDIAHSSSGSPATALHWLRHHPLPAAFFTVLMTLLLASAWLVFPYFVEGRGLLKDVGGTVQKNERRAAAIGISKYLTRIATGPGEADVEVMFATPRYFEVADKARVAAEYRPDLYHVFVVVETTHVSDLPLDPPRAVLVVDGRTVEAADIEGPSEALHHRVTTIRFPRRGADGGLTIGGDAMRAEIRLQSSWDDARSVRSAVWELPIQYPDEIGKGGIFSPIMVVALSAGLLSAVLTPCLLQLIVVYLATITGLGAQELGRPGAIDGAASRRIFVLALAFVVGFIALYTASGAVIGYAGKGAQLLFAEWSRPASVAAGIVVIAMGLWIGIKGRAPVVCRIPVPATVRNADQGGIVRSTILAAGFSFGCMACFGGAIIATLLVYVGALGSATVGAAVMFMFSLGVAIPFLLAALFLAHALPAMKGIARYTPQIALFSMAVIVAFGVVLVTDNFHVLSSLIYPWLGLG